MRLLCVVPSYLPAHQFGGPIFSLHGLNKALAARGVDVTVCTTDAGIEGKVETARESVIDGVKVIYFPFSRYFEFMGPTGWQFSAAMNKYLDSNVKAFDIAYILSVWNYPVAAASHYCRKYKVPYIISPRGMLYPYMFNKKAWKKFLYYKLVSKCDLSKASAIHYTSADEAEKCHTRLGFKNKALVVPNGLDLNDLGALPSRGAFRARYPFLKDKKIILFLGRIHWKKGLDILVKAFAGMAERRDDIHLVIAGNDEAGFSRTVKRWIKEAGMVYNDPGSGEESSGKSVKITFTGLLTGREKWEALIDSDVFALPSYSENFGMAVVEAMATGLPVVISDQVGICKEVESANAGAVVPNDAAEVSRELERILADRKLAIEMGENGKRLVRDVFLWDKIADTMVAALKEITAQKTTMEQSRG